MTIKIDTEAALEHLRATLPPEEYSSKQIEAIASVVNDFARPPRLDMLHLAMTLTLACIASETACGAADNALHAVINAARIPIMSSDYHMLLFSISMEIQQELSRMGV
jgi:hypothetical protein